MDNTWYYTLSTIVQALAAVFALGATFLVFKLQVLNEEVREYRNKAIKSLVYIESKSETKYGDFTLIEISDKFFESVDRLNPLDNELGIGSNYHQLKNKWVMMTETGFAHVDDKTFNDYFVFLLKQNAKAFRAKVNYRLNLYRYTLITGIILAFTMILSLAMLSGLSHPLNFFGYSALYSIRFVSIFACAGIVSVMGTAFYAIWGDRY